MLKGNKVHPVRFNQWYRADLGKDGKDEFSFEVPARMDVAFTLTHGMQGRLYAVGADGALKPVEVIAPQTHVHAAASASAARARVPGARGVSSEPSEGEERGERATSEESPSPRPRRPRPRRGGERAPRPAEPLPTKESPPPEGQVPHARARALQAGGRAQPRGRGHLLRAVPAHRGARAAHGEGRERPRPHPAGAARGRHAAPVHARQHGRALPPLRRRRGGSWWRARTTARTGTAPSPSRSPRATTRWCWRARRSSRAPPASPWSWPR